MTQTIETDLATDTTGQKRGKAKLRGNDQGTMYFNKARNCFVWQVTTGFSPHGQQKRVSGTSKTKSDALKALASATSDRDRGLLASPNQVTVKEYCQKWLEQQSVRLKTRDSYQWELGLACEYIGRLKVKDVKATHIKDMLNQLCDRPMQTSNGKTKTIASRSLSHVRTRIRAVFKEAMYDQIIYVSPAESVKPVKVKRTENPGMALDFDQVALLHEVGSALHGAGVARFWGAIFTAVSVGLRKAEVMGLRWQDVNLEQGILQIRHTAVSHRGQPIREEVTKTSHSRRDVQIPPSLKALLTNHREAQTLEKFNAGDAWTETGAVFATLTGAWTHPDNLNRALTSLLGWLEPQGLETRLRGVPVEHRAKLKAIVQDGQPFPKISPHDLRHTAGTLMLRKNVPVEVVSKTLGHADISITYKVYRHVLESEKREHVVDLFDHIPPKRVFESAIVN